MSILDDIMRHEHTFHLGELTGRLATAKFWDGKEVTGIIDKIVHISNESGEYNLMILSTGDSVGMVAGKYIFDPAEAVVLWIADEKEMP